MKPHSRWQCVLIAMLLCSCMAAAQTESSGNAAAGGATVQRTSVELPQTPTPQAELTAEMQQSGTESAVAAEKAPAAKIGPEEPQDADGKPIPLERQEPKRILGFMPNFRTVSGGAKPPAPGWKNNFIVATHQATDYSSFIFLGLTSLTSEGMDEHRVLGKGMDGFYAYTWRGFLDKSDNTYLSAFLLSSLLHEDTRYYALGAGHSIAARSFYVISRQAVARTYGGSQTPNFAGLGAKVLTQVVSRSYYPPSAADFATLATKFGYSVMRDVAFSAVREFYPDVAAHYIRKHRAKVAQESARDAAEAEAAPHPAMLTAPQK